MPKLMIALLVCLLVPPSARAEEQEHEPAPVLSPDKKWAYRLVEAQPVIARADTGEVVLQLTDEGNSLAAETGEVLLGSGFPASGFQLPRRRALLHLCRLRVSGWKMDSAA